ncbi:uncharacterized protein LOC143920141 [Arctopsyche grandis]|uniref:uncharacterized protein LOC143920141 n=1 Tax=Arctopsyche grandis TaxID=121162 RepID=UPI00406D6F99
MTCRLCLCPVPDESSIPIYGSSESLELQERISNCCQLKVRKHDGLSHTMCLSCERNLTLFTQFKKICTQSDVKARQKSSKCLNIKLEEVLLDDLVWEDEPESQLRNPPVDDEDSIMRPSSCNPEETTPDIGEPLLNEENNDTSRPICNVAVSSQVDTTKPSATLDPQKPIPKRAEDFKYSTTERGKQMLIYSGFEYLHFRVSNGVSTWRCRQGRTLRCHSSMKINENNVIVCYPRPHCHDSCPQTIEANIAKRKMVQAMRVIGANTQNVIGSVLSEVSNEALAYLPKKSSLSRTLLKIKQLSRLSLNFDISENYKEIVLHDTGKNDPCRILALGDAEIVKELRKDMIFGDGTFDKVPQISFQLYTWHARVGNSYPPFAYFLLPNKTTATYERMFDIMKQLVPDLAPENILLDFEKAAMNAARSAFPQSEVKGSYFHLTQSLIRKIDSAGLKSAFENDLEVKLNLKSLPALAFVPDEDVKSVFLQLTATFPEEECYEEVVTYFCSTYIEGVAGNSPQFPTTSWNHYSVAGEMSPKTSNCCEWFHNTLNAIFNCRNPSIWYLFDGIQRDLASHKLTVTNVKSAQLETRSTKYKRLKNEVASVVSAYHQTENKLLYLRHLANLQ